MVPTVKASVTLKPDLSAVLSVGGNIVPAAHFADLVKGRV